MPSLLRRWIPRESIGTPAARTPGHRELSRLRRFVFGTITIVLSLLFSFAILEFGLAAFYYSNTAEIERYVFDSELGWTLRPGRYTIKPPQTFSRHQIYINRLGLRGPEIESKTQRGTKRIIVLGDSFTFGENAPDEVLFTTQLEKRLNQNLSTTKFQVVNAGVPGYGNAQELLLVRRLARHGIAADIYVLNVFTNDILDNLGLDYGSLSQNLVQPRFALTSSGKLILEHKPQNTLITGSNLQAVHHGSRSRLYSVTRANLESLLQAKPGLLKFAKKLGFTVSLPRAPGVLNAWYDDKVLEAGVPLMKELVREIDAEVRSLGGTLLVCLIPSPLQVYPETYGPILKGSLPDNPMVKRFLVDPNRPDRIVRQMCQDLGIPLLELYGYLAENNEQSFYLPADGHFNNAGHTAFAISLEKFVRDHLPPNDPPHGSK